jgi:hypothetical protein
MISQWMSKILGQNWKTNLAAVLTFAATVPAVVTAFQQWSNHQAVDWRAAVVGLIVAAGLGAAKDSTTHSTSDQVQQASMTAQLEEKGK